MAKSTKQAKGKTKKSSSIKAGGGLGGIASAAISTAASAFGGKSKGTGKRRGRKGPNYWANKVLVEKLKKRYYRLKFGGLR